MKGKKNENIFYCCDTIVCCEYWFTYSSTDRVQSTIRPGSHVWRLIRRSLSAIWSVRNKNSEICYIYIPLPGAFAFKRNFKALAWQKAEGTNDRRDRFVRTRRSPSSSPALFFYNSIRSFVSHYFPISVASKCSYDTSSVANANGLAFYLLQKKKKTEKKNLISIWNRGMPFHYFVIQYLFNSQTLTLDLFIVFFISAAMTWAADPATPPVSHFQQNRLFKQKKSIPSKKNLFVRFRPTDNSFDKFVEIQFNNHTSAIWPASTARWYAGKRASYVYKKECTQNNENASVAMRSFRFDVGSFRYGLP